VFLSTNVILRLISFLVRAGRVNGVADVCGISKDSVKNAVWHTFSSLFLQFLKHFYSF